jgi:hypothetical protein
LRTGKFSSDRTIKEYAEEIWKLTPCKVAEEADFDHTEGSTNNLKIEDIINS